MGKINNRTTKHQPQVTIIGAGEIGRAVNHILTKRGISPNVWDHDATKNLCQRPLEETLPDADFLFLCIPSWCLVNSLNDLRPLLNRRTVVVSLSKGIEKTTGLTIDEVLRANLPKGQPFALLAGPMLAEEIMQDLKAAAVVASTSAKARTNLTNLFAKSDLRVTPTADLSGTALASVLKNVYAISLGIADGLGWGGNRKGWLTARAAAEMSLILKDNGAAARTADSDAGLADLVSTGFSLYSSNHQTGAEIVKTRKVSKRCEGATSLPALIKRLGVRHRKYPLLVVLAGVLMKRCDSHKAFEQYFHDAS